MGLRLQPPVQLGAARRAPIFCFSRTGHPTPTVPRDATEQKLRYWVSFRDAKGASGLTSPKCFPSRPHALVRGWALWGTQTRSFVQRVVYTTVSPLAVPRNPIILFNLIRGLKQAWDWGVDKAHGWKSGCRDCLLRSILSADRPAGV